MKILYAIQGTGNGHLTRARDIIPILQRKAELDLLVSGNQSDLDLPFEVKYRFKGLSFVFGKKGGVDLVNTYLKGSIKRLIREINSLPIADYDLIINDFEPVSAWAAYLYKKPCIALSHQAAVLSQASPYPQKKDLLGRMILKTYAPYTAAYGFHFARFADNMFTPVIRRQVREAAVSNQGHYTVYLPAYDDKQLVKNLKKIKGIEWDVFSKHNPTPYQEKNVRIRPIHDDDFVASLAGSDGVLCGAGFETPAEALFLQKKLLVIPMKNQYEQHCNAAALRSMGVPVVKSLKKKHLHKIEDWIANGEAIPVNYPDITENIIDWLLSVHTTPRVVGQQEPTNDQSPYPTGLPTE